MRRPRAPSSSKTETKAKPSPSARKRRVEAPAPPPPPSPPLPVQPTPPPGNQLRLGRPRGAVPHRYGDEVDEAREWVRTLIRQSFPLDAIIINARTLVPPLTRSQVVRYWQEVRSEMHQSFEANAEQERAAQAEQIRFDLGQMMQQTPKPWARITAHRRLLAELTGTLAPLEVNLGVDVDVRVRSAMMRVVGNLTAEQFDRYADRGVINTTGTAAE